MTGTLQKGMKEEQPVGPSSKGSTSFRNFMGRGTTMRVACHLFGGERKGLAKRVTKSQFVTAHLPGH